MTNILTGMMGAAGVATSDCPLPYPTTPGGTPILWFAGDDVTLSGTDVTQWNDKSSSGFDATKLAASTNYATLDATDSNFNGKPTLNFPGSSLYELSGETMGDIMTATEFEWWFVGMATFAGAYNYMFGDTSGYWWFGPQTSGLYKGGDQHVEVSLALSTPGMFQLGQGIGGTSNLILRGIDGAEDDYGSNVNYYSGSWLSHGIRIAGRGTTGASYPFRGDIAEIICYTSPLTGDALTQTKCYLAGKYDMEW